MVGEKLLVELNTEVLSFVERLVIFDIVCCKIFENIVIVCPIFDDILIGLVLSIVRAALFASPAGSPKILDHRSCDDMTSCKSSIARYVYSI